ncbi:MAG: hypothetical protein IJ744_09510 [Lachnospiraceae bacterium]|nr:hypothetical protein [Lachnospiraceae bacterium]
MITELSLDTKYIDVFRAYLYWEEKYVLDNYILDRKLVDVNYYNATTNIRHLREIVNSAEGTALIVIRDQTLISQLQLFLYDKEEYLKELKYDQIERVRELFKEIQNQYEENDKSNYWGW